MLRKDSAESAASSGSGERVARRSASGRREHRLEQRCLAGRGLALHGPIRLPATQLGALRSKSEEAVALCWQRAAADVL